MSSSPQNALLNDLGRVNNLNDPVPFLNDQGTILGIVVTFLVRIGNPPTWASWLPCTVFQKKKAET